MSSTLTQIDKTARYIKRKGFTHIKVELEANLNRNRNDGDSCPDCYDGYSECEHDTRCENCDMGTICAYSSQPYDDCDNFGHPPGERENGVVVVDGECLAANCQHCEDGHVECEEGHTCETCDGTAITEGLGGMTDEYCKLQILNNVSPEARKSLTYSRFYYDGSVDSEYTFTIPVEAIGYLPEFLKAFKSLGDETGTFQVQRAGMHIAVLMDGVYPVANKSLDAAKLRNFKAQMPKVMPALFFMASADHTSRPLGFRMPQVSTSKYSAIHEMRGGFEYRVFQTCYDRPEMILQFIDTIAKTLKFYGTAQIKQQVFKKFNFPDTTNDNKAYLSRFFNSVEQIEALDNGLKYLKPDYISIEDLKRQRHFKPNFDQLYAETKLRKEYIKYVDEVERRRQADLKHTIQAHLIKNKSTRQLYDVKLNPAGLKKLRNEILAGLSQPLSFERWKQQTNNNPYADNFTINL